MKKSLVLWAFLAFVVAVLVNEKGRLDAKSEEGGLSKEEQTFAKALTDQNRETFVTQFSAEQRKHAIESKGVDPNAAVHAVESELVVQVIQNNDFAETTQVR